MTFQTIDVKYALSGVSVAIGADFHEHPTKQGAVFFIAGEGHNGLGRQRRLLVR